MRTCIFAVSSRFSLRRIAIADQPTRNFCALRTGFTPLALRSGRGYLVQEHDMILRAIELAKEAGLQVCLDMASYNIVAGDHEFFSLLVNKYVDIVFANEEEAKAFTDTRTRRSVGYYC